MVDIPYLEKTMERVMPNQLSTDQIQDVWGEPRKHTIDGNMLEVYVLEDGPGPNKTQVIITKHPLNKFGERMDMTYERIRSDITHPEAARINEPYLSSIDVDQENKFVTFRSKKYAIRVNPDGSYQREEHAPLDNAK